MQKNERRAQKSGEPRAKCRRKRKAWQARYSDAAVTREEPAGEVPGKGTRIRHNIPPELRCSITSGERAPRRDPYNSKISAET